MPLIDQNIELWNKKEENKMIPGMLCPQKNRAREIFDDQYYVFNDTLI